VSTDGTFHQVLHKIIDEMFHHQLIIVYPLGLLVITPQDKDHHLQIIVLVSLLRLPLDPMVEIILLVVNVNLI